MALDNEVVQCYKCWKELNETEIVIVGTKRLCKECCDEI